MKSEHRYTQGWAWPDEVRDWVRERMHGRVINICAGESRMGDVQVDADPEREPDIVADMTNLPFETGSFDTAISDPPWNINFFARRQPFYEATRVVREGGTVIYNCPWRPTSSWVKLVDSTPRIDTDWGEVSMLWEFERHEHNSAAETDW